MILNIPKLSQPVEVSYFWINTKDKT